MMKLKLLETPGSALIAAGRIDSFRAIAWLLAAAMLLTIISLFIVPWQQSVRGQGRVIAYAPLERQQNVEAPIEGRITHWYVQEGDEVQQGELLATIADNDPNILRRIRREQESIRNQIQAVDLAISLTETQIASQKSARESAISNAKLRVRMATDRRNATIQSVDAAKAKLRTAELNLERQRSLFSKGLASTRELELAELEQQTSQADLDRARAALSAANSEIEALIAEKSGVSFSNQASIESTRSSLEKLKVEKAKAEGELAKVEVRLARQAQMQVVAPRSGTVLRLLAKQGTEMVKMGDPVLTLVPIAESRAVEIYIDGNDAPLIAEGRMARLQFEGWPAVQFVGWPSVAVGTFAGKVAFVDAHDDGYGRFRIVIVPEDNSHWPESRYLRQGVRANAWVLLNQVSLGFELWRQFNGFPPSIRHEYTKSKDSKLVKS